MADCRRRAVAPPLLQLIFLLAVATSASITFADDINSPPVPGTEIKCNPNCNNSTPVSPPSPSPPPPYPSPSPPPPPPVPSPPPPVVWSTPPPPLQPEKPKPSPPGQSCPPPPPEHPDNPQPPPQTPCSYIYPGRQPGNLYQPDYSYRISSGHRSRFRHLPETFVGCSLLMMIWELWWV